MQRKVTGMTSHFIPEDKLKVDLRQVRDAILGYGDTSTVYKGILSTDEGPEEVAVKIGNHVFAESFTTRKLQSKYIVEMWGVLRTSTDLLGIVMKRYKGDLRHHLEEAKSISLKQKLEWARDISYGLQYIHSQGYVCVDLKCSNILLDEEENAVIADFDTVRFSPLKVIQDSGALRGIGTHRYAAPELFGEDAKHFEASADVYSLGALLLYIVTGKNLFPNHMDQEIYLLKRQGQHAPIPEDCPPIFRNLINACCHSDPSQRPSAEWVAKQCELALENLKLPQKISGLMEYAIPRYKLKIGGSVLGMGGSAIVNEGSYAASHGQEKIAVKFSPKSTDILSEAITIRKLQSKYIVKMWGVVELPNGHGIVMKCYKGDLKHHLDEAKSISLKQKLEWARDISYGLQYIHSQGYVCVDVKCENILLDEENNAVIADLNTLHFPKEVLDNKDACTYPYAAPELFLDDAKPFAASADIYSLGALLLEMVTGNFPFLDLNSGQIATLKKKGKHAPIPEDCPPIFRNLINACCHSDPGQRPSAEWVAAQCELALKNLQVPLDKLGLFKAPAKEKISIEEIAPPPAKCCLIL